MGYCRLPAQHLQCRVEFSKTTLSSPASSTFAVSSAHDPTSAATLISVSSAATLFSVSPTDLLAHIADSSAQDSSLAGQINAENEKLMIGRAKIRAAIQLPKSEVDVDRSAEQRQAKREHAEVYDLAMPPRRGEVVPRSKFDALVVYETSVLY